MTSKAKTVAERFIQDFSHSDNITHYEGEIVAWLNKQNYFSIEQVEAVAREATCQAIMTDAHFDSWWQQKKESLIKGE